MKYAALLLAVFLLSPSMKLCLADSEKDDAKPGHRVAIGIDEVLHDGNFRAEAHERYHHRMAKWYHTRDTIGTMALMVGSVFALCIPLIQKEYLSASPKYSRWVQFLGVFLVSASIIGSFLGFSAKYMDHAVQAKRWSSLRTDWVDLRASISVIGTKELRDRAYHLSQVESRIESAEPTGPDNKLLIECFDETAIAMNLKPTSKPDKKS